jgi:hypothetical protein
LTTRVAGTDRITLAARAAGTDRITLAARVAGASPIAAGVAAILSKLRVAAEPASAFVARVWWHCTTMRTLCIELCLGRRSVTALRFSSFVLSHRETCKTTHGAEYRKREEQLDHAYLHC